MSVRNRNIYVIPERIAWDGGLREGFEIISVNETPIGSLGYLGIYDMLSDTSINEYHFLVETPTGDVSNYIVLAE